MDENLEDMRIAKSERGLKMLREILAFNKKDAEDVKKILEDMGAEESKEENKLDKSKRLRRKRMEALDKKEKEMKAELKWYKKYRREWNKIVIVWRSHNKEWQGSRTMFERKDNEKNMGEYVTEIGEEIEGGDYHQAEVRREDLKKNMRRQMVFHVWSKEEEEEKASKDRDTQQGRREEYQWRRKRRRREKGRVEEEKKVIDDVGLPIILSSMII